MSKIISEYKEISIIMKIISKKKMLLLMKELYNPSKFKDLINNTGLTSKQIAEFTRLLIKNGYADYDDNMRTYMLTTKGTILFKKIIELQ